MHSLPQPIDLWTMVVITALHWVQVMGERLEWGDHHPVVTKTLLSWHTSCRTWGLTKSPSAAQCADGLSYWCAVWQGGKAPSAICVASIDVIEACADARGAHSRAGQDVASYRQ